MVFIVGVSFSNMDTVVVEVPGPIWARIREWAKRSSQNTNTKDFLELLELLERAPAVGVKFDRKEAHRY